VRYLGIDFGERRIGLAISDPAGRVATPLATLERRSDEQAIEAIRAIASDEAVEALVIGEPRRLDGTAGSAAVRAGAFADKLAAATGLPCERVDEALTSVEAAARLREAGVDPRRHRDRLDALSAQILLQEHLDSAERAR
jgi:putative Holliday junction resolvase